MSFKLYRRRMYELSVPMWMEDLKNREVSSEDRWRLAGWPRQRWPTEVKWELWSVCKIEAKVKSGWCCCQCYMCHCQGNAAAMLAVILDSPRTHPHFSDSQDKPECMFQAPCQRSRLTQPQLSFLVDIAFVDLFLTLSEAKFVIATWSWVADSGSFIHHPPAYLFLGSWVCCFDRLWSITEVNCYTLKWASTKIMNHARGNLRWAGLGI